MTFVWLCALTDSTGVSPVLGFSGPSDCGSSNLRPFMSCSPERLARHAGHDFVWLSALTGVVGTFCTVLRARRVPRFLRISRISFLHALVVMFTMPPSPCHAKTFVWLPASGPIHWSGYGPLHFSDFLGSFGSLGSPSASCSPCLTMSPTPRLATTSVGLALTGVVGTFCTVF